MHYTPSLIWHDPQPNMKQRIQQTVQKGLASASPNSDITVFFRADDIGVPGRQFYNMMEIFKAHHAPLCLAVVPTWLTPARWKALQETAGADSRLWCWHQHGWRHCNHETEGKKQEFGPGRQADAIRTDLEKGWKRLENLMGDSLYPAFTPPWNRCSKETLQILKELEFQCLSRSRGAVPDPPEGLADFQVNVDLHTRKDPAPDIGWDKLYNELALSISEGVSGIMLHHQRINRAAFDFLNLLIEEMKRHPRIRLVHFGDFSFI